MDSFIKCLLDSFKQINISNPKKFLIFLNETDNLIIKIFKLGLSYK